MEAFLRAASLLYLFANYCESSLERPGMIAVHTDIPLAPCVEISPTEFPYLSNCTTNCERGRRASPAESRPSLMAEGNEISAKERLYLGQPYGASCHPGLISGSSRKLTYAQEWSGCN